MFTVRFPPTGELTLALSVQFHYKNILACHSLTKSGSSSHVVDRSSIHWPRWVSLEIVLGLKSLAPVLYCGIGSNKLVPGGLVQSALLQGKGGLWFSFPLHS